MSLRGSFRARQQSCCREGGHGLALWLLGVAVAASGVLLQTQNLENTVLAYSVSSVTLSTKRFLAVCMW